MATPKPNLAAPQGQNSAQFISSLQLMLMPDYQKSVIKNYGLDDSVKEFILKEIPKMIQTEHLSGTWAEIDSDFKESVIASAVSTAGSNVLVTYSTADMYTIGGTPQSPFNVGDDVMVANPVRGGDPVHGKIITKNTAGAQHIITITPYNAAEDLVAAIAVGSTILYAGRTVGEGSIKGQGVVKDITSYSNTMALIRNDHTATDLAKIEPAWFEFADSKGNVGVYYNNYVDKINAMKFLQNVQMTMLTGKQSNLSIASAESTLRPVRGTEGYLTQIDNRGQDVSYSLAPNFQDFYEISNILRDQGVKGEVDAKMGSEYYNQMEIAIRRDLGDGAIVYPNPQSVIDMRVGKVMLGGFTFNSMNYDPFNHKEMYGHPSLDFRDRAYFCPTDKRTDTQTGKKMDSMHMRYVVPVGKGTGANIAGVSKPWMRAWTFGGAAMDNLTGDNIESVSYLAHLEPRVMGANRFIKSYKQ